MMSSAHFSRYTKTDGKGIKIGKADISNTNIKDKTYTIGGGIDKNGRKHGKLGYETKDTNIKSIGYGDKKISRSDYTTKKHEITGGVRKDKKGLTVDGAYSNKNIVGQKYSVGKTSYTRENEQGNKYSGKVHVGKDGVSAKGGAEKYDKQTHKVQVGKMEASYSKKDYQKVEGGIKGKYRNGVFKGSAGGSYTNGQTHTGKIGGVKVTAGKEEKISGKGRLEVSKKGVKAHAQGSLSTTYKGGFQAGKVKAEGYGGQAQIVKGSLHANKHGVNVKGSYEQKYYGGANVKVGKTRVGIKGGVSKKTFGGAGVNINKNGGSVHAHVGREYKAGGNVKVNGKEVGKVEGKVKGQVGAKVGIDKKKGLTAQAGANGQAKGEVKIGNIDTKVNLSSDLKVEAKIDNKGLHLGVKGGIHAGLDVKDTKTGKNLIHAGGDAKGQAKADINKGKVKTSTSASTKVWKGNQVVKRNIFKQNTYRPKPTFNPVRKTPFKPIINRPKSTFNPVRKTPFKPIINRSKPTFNPVRKTPFKPIINRSKPTFNPVRKTSFKPNFNRPKSTFNPVRKTSFKPNFSRSKPTFNPVRRTNFRRR